jgi:hypothetical protein
MEKRFTKEGQITLFILLGIVVISVILIFFLWIRPTYILERSGKLSFEGCIKETIEQSVKELEKKAGYINPEFAYSYNGEKIPYLCYTNEYYKTCTIQKPFLKQHFEEQLGEYVSQKINICYEDSLSQLKEEGYDIVSGKLNYNISIEPEIIRVLINAPTTIGSDKFSKFNIGINSPLYDILMLATSLLQFETAYGDSDVDYINDLYPDYYIEKLKMEDGTTVYTINSKIFGNKFQFASRSIAWPAGYI